MPDMARCCSPQQAIVEQVTEELGRAQGVEQTAAVNALLSALIRLDNTAFASALQQWLERAAWDTRANVGTRSALGNMRVRLREKHGAAIAAQARGATEQSDDAEITAADGVQIAATEQPVNGARA